MISAVSTSPFHLIFTRKFNTWYSIKDGNWSDPNTWMSNALDKKLTLYPQPGDNVYVHHNVNLDIDNQSVTGLYGNGMLVFGFTNRTFTINSALNMSGGMDMSSAIHNLVLNGYTNSVGNFIGGTNGTVVYNGFLAQNIMPITYCHLTTANAGNKYLIANTTLNGNLSVYNLECGSYDLTVGGTTKIPNTNTGMFSKSGPGNLLFIGQFSFGENSTIDWSVGNPSAEFRGGIAFNSYTFNTGTGTFTFTTNNQSAQFGANISGTWNAPVLISGAIALTITGNLNSFATVNGNNTSSTLNNNGTITQNITTLPMATGIFNYQYGTGSTMAYTMLSNFTLPYTSYNNLSISNYIKYLSGNTTINGNLSVFHGFECGSYNLTVNGSATISNGSDGSSFSKNGPGNLLFIGLVGNGGNCGIDFSGGNPSVEFRGGLSLNGYFINTGTGQFTFTTNNQSINITANNTGTWNAPILISGAITLTNTSNFNNIFKGVVNGDNTNSVLDNRGTFNYQNATAPMNTGKLYCNAASNIFIYGLSSGQDITPPTDPINSGYYNLTLNGSGAKRLLGNISVKNTYTLTTPATLNLNGYTLTNP
jgi:hypothetical protein